MKQPTRSAKTVTQQELCQSVEWGQFAGVSEKVSLMTPPLHILQAVACDSLKPTDIAYVIVVGAKQKKKKTKRPRKTVPAAPGVVPGTILQESQILPTSLTAHSFVGYIWFAT